MNIKKQSIHNYEKAICKIILCCISEVSSELDFSLGIGKIVSILKGKKSTFVIENGLNNFITYSALMGFTGKQIKDIIEMLFKERLIGKEMVSRFNRPVLGLTIDGQNFINSKCKTKIHFLEEFIDRDIIELYDKEKQLYTDLKRLRRDVAREEEIPAYCICTDTVLRSLAKQKPITSESLHLIHGIGDSFIQKYADLFVNNIKQHINSMHTIDSFKQHKEIKELIKEKDIESELSPRQQKILEMRFGLDNGISHTLAEIGKEFGITRERVRQIINNALNKLKIKLPK